MSQPDPRSIAARPSVRLRGRVRRLARSLVHHWLDRVATDEETYELLGRLTPFAASRTSPTFFFSTRDVEVARHLYLTSSFDEAELAWALRYLGEPQRRGLVIEVGGNVGSTTVSLAAGHGAPAVLAFEPETQNYALLQCNVIMNGLSDRVRTEQLAITDASGVVQIELAPENLGDHRVRSAGPTVEGVLREDARPTVDVRAKTLTDAVRDAGADVRDVSLVWVDTQGHEAQVLAGAGAVLEARAPWVMEYWPYGLRRSAGLDRLHGLVAQNFSSIVDIRESMAAGRPIEHAATEIASLAARASGPTDHMYYTDLILLP